ncbi:MAG: SMP-30/gluconolactonase/LRE family protein [Streptosporangiales bacterium]|nr:SMP-30/gluconolactonase/LRE family protein [Streptosporangiales bacterium]
MHAEQATDPIAHHGEGPVWDPTTNRLLSVDMLDGDVLTLDPESGDTTCTHVHSVAACVRPRVSGGYVVAVERGFALLDLETKENTPLPELWVDRNVRMNEGGCDPQGRFYCGSMAYDKRPGKGTLWRLDPDGHTTAVLDSVTISNGLVWSLDGSVVYYIDTPTLRVDAFTFHPETGTFSDRRPVVTVPEGQGRPDGMTIDSEGGLWVAMFGGSCVRRYRPDGELDAEVDLPVTQVTACTFGGPDLDTLYITTSSYNLPRHHTQTAAGAIFAIKPGARGVPVSPFAG